MSRGQSHKGGSTLQPKGLLRHPITVLDVPYSGLMPSEHQRCSRLRPCGSPTRIEVKIFGITIQIFKNEYELHKYVFGVYICVTDCYFKHTIMCYEGPKVQFLSWRHM